MSLESSTGIDEAATLVALVLASGFAALALTLSDSLLLAVLPLFGYLLGTAVLYSPRFSGSETEVSA